MSDYKRTAGKMENIKTSANMRAYLESRHAKPGDITAAGIIAAVVMVSALYVLWWAMSGQDMSVVLDPLSVL